MELIIFAIAAMVGLAAFTCLGSWVANQKGRSGTEGAVLGVVFGPFGVLIEALLPAAVAPARSSPSRPQPKTSNWGHNGYDFGPDPGSDMSEEVVYGCLDPAAVESSPTGIDLGIVEPGLSDRGTPRAAVDPDEKDDAAMLHVLKQMEPRRRS